VDKVLGSATSAYQCRNPHQKVIPWFSWGAQVTDASAILPQGKFPGIIFSTMFGYSALQRIMV
jgi:high-affinity iron transporter